MTAFITYAQNFEDVLLWRALRQVEVGTYVDVGANDPVVDSVSKAFYDRGWRGVHVEPVAEYAERLRRARPDEQVIQAALGVENGLLTFFDIPHTGMSTAVPEITETCRLQGYAVNQTTVPCLRLDDVLGLVAAPEIHWLKIDVEGFEHQVLAGWSGRRRPWILVVEAMVPQSQVEAHEGWEPLILEKGYVHVFADGLNRYYLASEHLSLRDAFRYGANVFDGFWAANTCWISHAVVRERDRQGAEQAARVEDLHRALVAAEARAEALSTEIVQVRQDALTRERTRLNDMRDRERDLNERLCAFALRAKVLSDQLVLLRGHLSNPIWLIRYWLIGPKEITVSPQALPLLAPQTETGQISSLLALEDDGVFIDAAYRNILKRPGDPEGCSHYRKLLKQGICREDILAQIRLSREGRKVGVTLDGLAQLLCFYRYRKLPVLGSLLRLADRIRARRRSAVTS